MEDLIIQIGMIRLNPDGTWEKMESLVNPGGLISEEITEIAGITNEILQGAYPMGRW